MLLGRACVPVVCFSGRLREPLRRFSDRLPRLGQRLPGLVVRAERLCHLFEQHRELARFAGEFGASHYLMRRGGVRCAHQFRQLAQNRVLLPNERFGRLAPRLACTGGRKLTEEVGRGFGFFLRRAHLGQHQSLGRVSRGLGRLVRGHGRELLRQRQHLGRNSPLFRFERRERVRLRRAQVSGKFGREVGHLSVKRPMLLREIAQPLGHRARRKEVVGLRSRPRRSAPDPGRQFGDIGHFRREFVQRGHKRLQVRAGGVLPRSLAYRSSARRL